MKFFKKIGLGFLILLFFGMIFRKSIYNSTVTYKSIGERTNYLANNEELLSLIAIYNESIQTSEINNLIEISLAATNQQLQFSFADNKNNPNNLMENSAAHCVGYSNFFTTICQAFLVNHKIQNQWIVTHHVGQLYFFNVNVHNYFESPFFKDHDFVSITNTSTGEMYAVDPSLNDYLYIDFVNFQN